MDIPVLAAQTLAAEPTEAERKKHEAEVKRAREQWAMDEARWRQLQQVHAGNEHTHTCTHAYIHAYISAKPHMHTHLRGHALQRRNLEWLQADAKAAKKQVAGGGRAGATDSSRSAAAANVSQATPTISHLQLASSGNAGTDRAAACARKDQGSGSKKQGREAAATLEATPAACTPAAAGLGANATLEADRAGTEKAAAAAAAAAAPGEGLNMRGQEMLAKGGGTREKGREVEKEGGADGTDDTEAVPGSKKRGREGEVSQVREPAVAVSMAGAAPMADAVSLPVAAPIAAAERSHSGRAFCTA
eukprot:1144072-Pelagomonas_calceolata.AAC.2